MFKKSIIVLFWRFSANRCKRRKARYLSERGVFMRSNTTSKTFPFFIFLCAVLIAVDVSVSGTHQKECDCLAEAIERVNKIKQLPESEFLHTLDGQKVKLNEFYERCRSLFPFCCMFKKFYYWESEVCEITSKSTHGPVDHKIRCYHNCFSTCCPEKRDKRAKYGDVAEFYDQTGEFMGIVVYIGEGSYCSLPYSGYSKKVLWS